MRHLWSTNTNTTEVATHESNHTSLIGLVSDLHASTSTIVGAALDSGSLVAETRIVRPTQTVPNALSGVKNQTRGEDDGEDACRFYLR